jgi:hypothetical protein
MILPSTRSAAAALLILCGSSISVFAAPARHWEEYRNARYGFSLQYPADVFALERTSDAGDGQVFVARDGQARLLVGALANDSAYSPAAYQDYVARHSYPQYKIGYQRLGGSWFVLSGESDGRIFYEKVIFSCRGRLINSFAMIYPTEQRHVFDPIVETIEDTFRPGLSCDGAGPSAVPRQDQLAPLRHSGPLPHAERSALADRIARARGRDVFVILRRTSPPFDRKVVRGYVSPP